MRESLDNWFKREILPHEAALLRYLSRVWRQRDEIPDLRQEIYVRVYEAAAKSFPHSAKAFLFSIARNLIVDRVRRGRIVSIEAVSSFDEMNVVVDELSPERRLNSWQELRLVTQALNNLSPRCREVVWLRKVNELSTKEVAELLGLSERTVQTQLLRGLRVLSNAVLSKIFSPMQGENNEDMDRESEHGEP